VFWDGCDEMGVMGWCLRNRGTPLIVFVDTRRCSVRNQQHWNEKRILLDLEVSES
jgi:hypothetical protein